MEYIHPKEYKWGKVISENYQIYIRNMVESYCLKCDKFMGKEHDFSECRMKDLWEYNEKKDKFEITIEKDCPFETMIPYFLESDIIYKVEEESAKTNLKE